MLSVLIKYLIAKLETFEYLDKVHGLSTIVQVGDETMPAVYSGNELVHVNFDSYDSLVYIQQNGKIGRETTEHPAIACKYNVVERYPLRLIVYSQGKENVNCESYSQQIADSIKAALNGKQQTLEAAANLTNATIILGDTDLDKNSVWQTQFSSPNQLKDSDILIAIDLEFEIEGDDTCFANNPCENSEFVFDLGTQTFCERVDACLDIPNDNGQYVLTITDNVISWDEYSPSGQVVISKTLAQFKSLAAAGTLQSPATYKITDVENGLYVKTFSGSEYATCNLLSLNCPKTYETTTLDGNVWKGIWRSSKTANINDLFIWGGVVWRNKTGAIGTATDVVTLDSTNWEYIDRNNFNNNEYIPLSLMCFYDFEQSWINYLQDEHSNIIGVDWHLNQIYGLNYNPSLQTDWNCMTKTGVIFTLNKLFYAINNLGSVIHNIANGSIFNNDYDVQDNKYCSVISNNTAAVYENIAAISDIDGAVNEVYNVNGGTFFFSHNFTTSPLTSGNALLFNYIPEDAYITCIKASGALTGTTIEIGLETDDEGLINEAVGLLPLEWSGVSAAATDNRSLKIKATGGNITDGTLTVKVEYII